MQHTLRPTTKLATNPDPDFNSFSESPRAVVAGQPPLQAPNTSAVLGLAVHMHSKVLRRQSTVAQALQMQLQLHFWLLLLKI